MDAIIKAAALAHDLAVWTNDDFAVLAELSPELRLDGSSGSTRMTVSAKHVDESSMEHRTGRRNHGTTHRPPWARRSRAIGGC